MRSTFVFVAAALAAVASAGDFNKESLEGKKASDIPGLKNRTPTLLNKAGKRTARALLDDLCAADLEVTDFADSLSSSVRGVDYSEAKRVGEALYDWCYERLEECFWCCDNPGDTHDTNPYAGEGDPADAVAAVEGGFQSIADFGLTAAYNGKLKKNGFDKPLGLIHLYLDGNMDSDTFVSDLCEMTTLPEEQAASIFAQIDVWCQVDAETCLSDLPGYDCQADSYMASSAASLEACGVPSDESAAAGRLFGFCEKPSLESSNPSLCVADSKGFVDWSACYRKVELQWGGILKDLSSQGLYQQCKECREEVKPSSADSSFFGWISDVWEGAREIPSLDDELSRFHGCVKRKIAETCPAPEPEPQPEPSEEDTATEAPAPPPEPVDPCEAAPVEMSDELRNHPKMSAFVNGCPAQKNADKIYGVGKYNSKRLENEGKVMAQDVVDQFRRMDCNADIFKTWLMQTVGTDDKSAEEILACVDNYYKNAEVRTRCEEEAAEAAAAAAAAEAALAEAAAEQKAQEVATTSEKEADESAKKKPKKWMDFNKEPAGSKDVIKIHGIGDVTADALAAKKIFKAKQLLTAYADAQSQSDPEQAFTDFMKDRDAYSGRWTKEVYACIAEHCAKWPSDCTPTPEPSAVDVEEPAGEDEDSQQEELPEDWQLTVIQVYRPTEVNEDLFINGASAGDQENHPVPVRLTLGDADLWPESNHWGLGATELSWGRNLGQVTPYKGVLPSGLPMRWTAFKDDGGNPRRSAYNVRGDDVWEIEMEMDCSKLADVGGLFQFSAFVVDTRKGHDETSYGERDVTQGVCNGGVDVGHDGCSNLNHYGRCGKINSYDFNEADCWIVDFP